MSVFTSEEANDQHRDWIILRDGGVALYWRPEALKMDLSWLESNGYNVVEFDASRWANEEQMHDALRFALSFPYYYEKNLNALNDSLWSDLVVPDGGGTALVFHHYDQFARGDQTSDLKVSDIAEVVLTILARAVRYHMLFGRRLLILVQSDDPRIRFDNFAGMSADWNSRERLNKSRGAS